MPGRKGLRVWIKMDTDEDCVKIKITDLLFLFQLWGGRIGPKSNAAGSQKHHGRIWRQIPVVIPGRGTG